MIRQTLRKFRTLIETAQLNEMIANKTPVYILEAGLNEVNPDHFTARIPGAKPYVIAHGVDKSSKLPFMLPTENQFSDYLGTLDIQKDNRQIVCYDRSGIQFSPRVWWTFKVFGWENVAVLNGGLDKWFKDRYPYESGWYEYYIEKENFDSYTFDKKKVANAEEVLAISTLASAKSNLSNIIDVRPPKNFMGAAPEPDGVIPGHIPGAINIPNATWLTDDGLLKTPAEIDSILKSHNIDKDEKIITNCFAGIAACTGLLACEHAGAEKISLYDASWAEYNQRAFPEANTSPK